MENIKKLFLRFVLIGSFVLGLIFLFGAAGYNDWADEAGVYVSLGDMICRLLLGIFLMLPLSIFYAFGGQFDGDDENI